MIARLKARAAQLWQHRTKALAVIGGVAAYVQNHLAEVGHVLPPRLQGLILGVFSCVVFALGLYNMLTLPPPSQPPA